MPNIREGLLNLVSGAPNSPYRGLLSPAAQERARNTALTDASLQMILSSTGRPGDPAPTFMQALAGGLQAGRNSYGRVADAEILNQEALQQIQKTQQAQLAAEQAQRAQQALARHFAANPITPESLKTGAQIAASFNDWKTAEALIAQIEAVTPKAAEDKLTELQKNYQAYQDNLPPGETPLSWLEYQDAVRGKTPAAAQKPDRIPQATRDDIIIRTVKDDGEIVETAAPVGMTFEELEELQQQEGVTIESRTRLEEADLKAKKVKARDTDIDLLSNDLLSVDRLLTGGNTGGRIRTLVGYVMNDSETAELANLYDKLKAQFTLKELVSAKDKGVTFGALSDGERIMVAESIGKLEQTQKADLQRLELSKIVGAFARHGLVDRSKFSAEFLALAESRARKRVSEIEARNSSSNKSNMTAKFGLE